MAEELRFIFGRLQNIKEVSVEERYGLSLQMRRSALSIPSNIAEGYGRKSKQEYIHYLYMAYGSYCKFETQLLCTCQKTPGF